MNRFGKRWIAAGLCAALAASMLTGCSSVNKNDVVMTVDDTKVTLGEAAFWLRYNQANTEMYLGGLFGDGNMWEQDLFGTGEAYGTTIKEQILEDIKEMVLMEQHASEYSVALTAEEEAAFLENMAGAGRLLPLDDHLMDAGSAVAGCGPAFVDLFIEAMADGGVACGLTRPMAMECAAQTLIGAARLMLETGRHPGALKDAVCSPGGATIQGVRALEAGGFRSAVMEAVIAAYEKSAEMK